MEWINYIQFIAPLRAQPPRGCPDSLNILRSVFDRLGALGADQKVFLERPAFLAEQPLHHVRLGYFLWRWRAAIGVQGHRTDGNRSPARFQLKWLGFRRAAEQIWALGEVAKHRRPLVAVIRRR